MVANHQDRFFHDMALISVVPVFKAELNWCMNVSFVHVENFKVDI